MDQQLLARREATRRKPGFTLIEVLVVISIMAILLTLGATYGAGALESIKMRQAIETARQAMEHARQVALTGNQAVMFRIYTETDERGVKAWRALEFGVADVITDPSDPKYVEPVPEGYEPVFKRTGSIERLPAGLIFHPSATFSTLLGTHTALISGTENSPSDGQSRDYTAFVYLSDGRCSLPADQDWTLTIVKEQATGATLPPNYATLQLDPRTARVRIYRP